ncbi:MAG: hypothetical protein ACOX2Y_02980 [Christensenellales bacterium]
MLKSDIAKSAAEYAKNKAEYASDRADEAVDIASDLSSTTIQAKAKADQAYQIATTSQNLITVALSDAENASCNSYWHRRKGRVSTNKIAKRIERS